MRWCGALAIAVLGCSKSSPPSEPPIDPTCEGTSKDVNPEKDGGPRLRGVRSNDGDFAKDSCYEEKARKLVKPELCGAIRQAERRSRCWEDLAGQLVDEKLCLRIDDEVAQGPCLGKVATKRRSPVPCSSAKSAGPKAECIRIAAEASEDGTMCEAIELPELHDRCVETAAQRRPEFCMKCRIPAALDACLLNTATTWEKDAERAAALCGKIGTAATKDRCYARVAQRNPPLCENVGNAPDDPSRRACYVDAIPYANNFSACERIPDGKTVDLCWQAKAHAHREAAECGRITAQDIKDDCLNAEATAKNADQVCPSIVDKERRLRCARGQVSGTTHLALCDVLEGKEKTDCIATIKANQKRWPTAP
jgi:hypothetical protein